jgi:ankyrin repeat protein
MGLEVCNPLINGPLALIYHTKTGDIEQIRTLVDEGAFGINRVNALNQTALHVAISDNRTDIVKVLLEGKPNLDIQDEALKETPLGLALALQCDNVELVRALVEGGANLEIKGSSGNEPLLRAIESPYCSDAVVLALLSGSPNIEIKDPFGKTPLFRAINGRRFEIAKSLILANAKTEWENGYAAILVASKEKNSADFVKFLIDRSADMNQKDSDGNTSAHWAAIFNNLDVLQLLVDRGAKLDEPDILGRTPLAEAVEQGKTAVVKLTCPAKFDPN